MLRNEAQKHFFVSPVDPRPPAIEFGFPASTACSQDLNISFFALGVSLSTVNRAHMAYDHGGIEALKPKPNGGRIIRT